MTVTPLTSKNIYVGAKIIAYNHFATIVSVISDKEHKFQWEYHYDASWLLESYFIDESQKKTILDHFYLILDPIDVLLREVL